MTIFLVVLIPTFCLAEDTPCAGIACYVCSFGQNNTKIDNEMPVGEWCFDDQTGRQSVCSPEPPVGSKYVCYTEAGFNEDGSMYVNRGFKLVKSNASFPTQDEDVGPNEGIGLNRSEL